MGQPLIQPTFSGGELSPSLQARVDIERYGNSVKTGKNFLVRPYGGMVNRPGLQFLGRSASQAGGDAGRYSARIIPFVFLQVLALTLLFIFPELVTWLPKVLY